MINRKLFFLYEHVFLNKNVAIFDFGDHGELHSELTDKTIVLDSGYDARVFGNNRIFVGKKFSADFMTECSLIDDYLNTIKYCDIAPYKIKEGLFVFGTLCDSDFKELKWCKNLTVKTVIPESPFIIFEKKNSDKLYIYDCNGHAYNSNIYYLACGISTPKLFRCNFEAVK